MRVLILNYEYPPLGGGAGVATRYLLSELAQTEGVHARLITSSTGKSRVEQFAPNVAIHFLDIGKSGSLHYQSQFDLIVYAARAFALAGKLLRREAFDVVHAFFGIPCGAVAMRLGLPYIVSLRGSDVPFYNHRFENLDRFFFKRLSGKIWKQAAHVVANSDGLRELALQSAPHQTVSVIPNGVDVRFYTTGDGLDKFLSSGSDVHLSGPSPLRIVSTGRLIERKGYGYLIEALRGLFDVRLVLVGDGNLQGELQQAADAAGVTVQFAGLRSRDEVAKILRDSDLFVLPSLNEGMSNSLLEALASGLPAVVTEVGGSAELVSENVNGFIVPKADPAALRRAVEIYLRNPNLLSLHGRASRQIAEKMSIAENAKKYVTLYGLAKGTKR